jgi:DNA polymerase-3 subunit epsilon
MSLRWIGQNEEKTQVILYKFNSLFLRKNLTNEATIKIAILDVETTGLDYQKDEVIELGVLILEVGKESFQFYNVIHAKSYLNEPKTELSEKIKKITNIQDEQLKGKKIPVEEIDNLLTDCEFIIAHNAGFDRPFVEQIIPVTKNKIWLCSLTQIPWDECDFPEKSLKNLCIYHGFFYEAHRAISDCFATAHLISHTIPNKEETYLFELTKKINSSLYLLIAKKTEFKNKDFLKEKGFLFNNNFNYKTYDELNLADAYSMMSLLEETIYKDRIYNAELIEVKAVDKFKSTIELAAKKGLDLNITGKYTKDYVLLVENSYDYRQILSRRGYSLSTKYSGWYVYLNENEIENEKQWLLANKIYNESFGGKLFKNSYKKYKD